MKKTLAISIFATIMLAGCSGGQGAENDKQTPEEEVKTEQMTVEPKKTVKSFTVTASKWEFDPHTIGVRFGDTVRLTIESKDVIHGIAIPDFNVNQTIKPGETAIVEFVADKKGSFTFSCSVFCGSGHGDMKGTLIVQ